MVSPTVQLFDVYPFEPQGITHNGNGTETHGCSSNDRAEQNTKDRIQNAGSHWHSKGVVNKGKEQILLDVCHGGP